MCGNVAFIISYVTFALWQLGFFEAQGLRVKA